MSPDTVPTERAVKKAQELVKENRTFMFITRLIHARRRDKRDLDVYRIHLACNRGGFATTLDEVHEVFDMYQQMGLGKLTKRKYPANSSFVFNTSPRLFTAKVLGELEDPGFGASGPIITLRLKSGRTFALNLDELQELKAQVARFG